jgi:hypothetical protein
MKKYKSKATFVGCVKNVSINLPAVLQNIDRLSQLFEKTAFIFVENDSTDNTVEILQSWGNSRKDFAIRSLTGLDKAIQPRTMRLETCRNLYLAALKKTKPFTADDVVIMLDMDDVNSNPIEVSGFLTAHDHLIEREDVAAVTAIQQGAYYDLWALRHPEHFNRDLWEDVIDIALAENLQDPEPFERVFATCDTQFISRESPTEVDSAFGGLGIYKFNALVRNPIPYVGQHTKFLLDGGTNFYRMQRCEHVSFHLGFKTLGMKMVIHPSLVNGGYGAEFRLNPMVYRTLVI